GIVEFAEVLVGFQENVLRQVQSVFPVRGDAQEVIVDTFLPSRNEEVVALHAAARRLANQVGILDRPKDQISGSMCVDAVRVQKVRSEEHTSELQSQSNLVCRLLLE